MIFIAMSLLSRLLVDIMKHVSLRNDYDSRFLLVSCVNRSVTNLCCLLIFDESQGFMNPLLMQVSLVLGHGGGGQAFLTYHVSMF